jgi:hypothetical protein
MFFPKIPPEILAIMFAAALVIFGGIAHATAQLKIARDKNMEFTSVDFMILAFLGAFSGVMFGLLGTTMTDNQNLIYLFTGMGSFMGVAGLNWLSVWVIEKFGGKNHDKNS